MKGKKPNTEQPDLFSMDINPMESQAQTTSRKIKYPNADDVRALEKRTGESPRKCYYWLVAQMNKEKV